ncbi:MAG: DUF4181 domain-containing protein [Bacillus sp. (in: Bacteria)]|nr:DUF4181 domain-containing protein [Bacillus sp. (in: firmicutes)]
MTLGILFLFIIIMTADHLLGRLKAKGEYDDLWEFEDYSNSKFVPLVKWERRIGTVVLIVLTVIAYTSNNFHLEKWLIIFLPIIYFGPRSLLEWKFLEGKKHLVSLSIMAISALGLLFYFQWIHTTYGDAIEKLIDEGEQVVEIKLERTTYNDEEGYIRRMFNVTDETMINNLLETPAAMELVSVRNSPGITYIMDIITDQGRYHLTFSEYDMRMAGRTFVILEENKLINVIENMELDWQEREY